MTISRWILLRMRNVSDNSCTVQQLYRITKTHILCSVTFLSEYPAIFEIMWENMVERGGPQVTIWYSGAGHR